MRLALIGWRPRGSADDGFRLWCRCGGKRAHILRVCIGLAKYDGTRTPAKIGKPPAPLTTWPRRLMSSCMATCPACNPGSEPNPCHDCCDKCFEAAKPKTTRGELEVWKLCLAMCDASACKRSLRPVWEAIAFGEFDEVAECASVRRSATFDFNCAL